MTDRRADVQIRDATLEDVETLARALDVEPHPGGGGTLGDESSRETARMFLSRRLSLFVRSIARSEMRRSAKYEARLRRETPPIMPSIAWVMGRSLFRLGNT